MRPTSKALLYHFRARPWADLVHGEVVPIGNGSTSLLSTNRELIDDLWTLINLAQPYSVRELLQWLPLRVPTNDSALCLRLLILFDCLLNFLEIYNPMGCFRRGVKLDSRAHIVWDQGMLFLLQ